MWLTLGFVVYLFLNWMNEMGLLPRFPSTHRILLVACFSVQSMLSAAAFQGGDTYRWKTYRPTNTGIQGDSCEALLVGADGNPWIAGYHPGFEEGGFARYLVSADRWQNFSNVDFKAIGHPELLATSRISDMARDASGNLWMSTGRGALYFSPKLGAKSLIHYGEDNSLMHGGWNRSVEVAPDGTVWFSAVGMPWGSGGISQYNPKTNKWNTSLLEIGGGSLAIQPYSATHYLVWVNATNNALWRYDSAVGDWEEVAADVDEPAWVAGKNATDSQGNTWFFRWTDPTLFESQVDCLRPDGTWMNLAEPPFGIYLSQIRAKSPTLVLAVDGAGVGWRYDGTRWTDLGKWNESIDNYDIDQDAEGNVWMCGQGGAACRNARTGKWQRYRVTNTSQYDFFNEDLTLDGAGNVYATANATAGVGGMVKFDGERWTGYNVLHYGLGQDWPFNTDNSQRVYVRPSSGQLLVNPTFAGLHRQEPRRWIDLQATNSTIGDLRDDGAGRLWITHSTGTFLRRNNAWSLVSESSGKKIRIDSRRTNGKVWVLGDTTLLATDGTTTKQWTIEDFPELDTVSDQFKGMVVASDGMVWIGANTINLPQNSTVIKLNPVTGKYTTFRYGDNWPFIGQYAMPVAATSDGRVWFQYDSDFGIDAQGLCAYDGSRVIRFPAPFEGQFRWGGLPHAAILDVEVQSTSDGYQLWMCCASRGIAVLTVQKAKP